MAERTARPTPTLVELGKRQMGAVAEGVRPGLASYPKCAVQKAGRLVVAGVVQSQLCKEQHRLCLRVPKSELGQDLETAGEVRFRLLWPPEQ